MSWDRSLGAGMGCGGGAWEPVARDTRGGRDRPHTPGRSPDTSLRLPDRNVLQELHLEASSERWPKAKKNSREFSGRRKQTCRDLINAARVSSDQVRSSPCLSVTSSVCPEPSARSATAGRRGRKGMGKTGRQGVTGFCVTRGKMPADWRCLHVSGLAESGRAARAEAGTPPTPVCRAGRGDEGPRGAAPRQPRGPRNANGRNNGRLLQCSRNA